MTLNDDILKSEIRARIDIVKYGNKVVKDVLSLLAAVDRDLVNKINDEIAAHREGYWTTKRLDVLLVEVRNTIYDAYAQASDEVKAQMVEFAQFEKDRVVGVLDNAVGNFVNISTAGLSATQLKAIVSDTPIAVGPDGKLLLEEIFSALAGAKEKTIRQAIRMGMVEGEPIRDITKRLIGTPANRFTDGLIEKDRRGAEAMVRTVVNHVSNETAQLVYNTNSDIVDSVMWVATLDNRTTIICQSLDGKRFPLDSGPRPPAHVNCRSIIVPVIKSWESMGINMKELSPGTRASMNGYVPDKLIYPEWLKQNPQYAEDVLGTTRAKAFLEGGVSIENFVNDKGRTLTLEELRSKHIL